MTSHFDVPLITQHTFDREILCALLVLMLVCVIGCAIELRCKRPRPRPTSPAGPRLPHHRHLRSYQ